MPSRILQVSPETVTVLGYRVRPTEACEAGEGGDGGVG